MLAAYYAPQLRKQRIRARQASRRGGTLWLTVPASVAGGASEGADAVPAGRVWIDGTAVTVLRGTIHWQKDSEQDTQKTDNE